MPDWLKDASSSTLAGLTVAAAALRLLAAVVIGFAIAASYRLSVRKPASEIQSFLTTLVLLSALVAMTAMVIDNNIARAFSLVGALAIVRFRTVVEDTRDTAFVIFAVVAGMAAGVGNWVLCAVGVPLVGVVALLCGRGAPRTAGAAAGPEMPLLVRIGTGDDPKAELEPALKSRVAALRLIRTVTARQGAALELTYSVRLADGGQAVALVRDINAVKGVQHVELGEA